MGSDNVCPRAGSPGHTTPSPGLNILVVDDEAILLESIRIGLQPFGHQVLPAYSGQQALARILHGGQRVDLVLTDYLMPGMTGLDLLKAIRQVAPALPVVLMTAFSAKEQVLKELNNPCDRFLEKPFSLDRLIGEIDEIRATLPPLADGPMNRRGIFEK